MGSQAVQSSLWGQCPADWASVQELARLPAYTFVLAEVPLPPATRLLDVGCGTGCFAQLAAARGAQVTGLDATPAFVDEARRRVPAGQFVVGEMEELSFADGAFDLVCDFNSFQYAANVPATLREACRVLADGGRLVAAIWGNPADCEAASYRRAVGSLLPPPPPGAPGPCALSQNQFLEALLREAGLAILGLSVTDVPCPWRYPDADTALRGLLPAGPVARAIGHVGFERARDAVAAALLPYVPPGGQVPYRNTYRVVVAAKNG